MKAHFLLNINFLVSRVGAFNNCMIITQVAGVINNAEGISKYVVTGTWDDKIEGARVLGVEEVAKGRMEYKTEPSVTLWQRRFIP